MSLVRAVGRNTIIQFGGKTLGTGLGLVTVALLQRHLSPAGFGDYTTAMAYLGFLSVIADLGLYMMLIRELTKPGADEARVVGNLLGLRWASAAAILGIGTVGIVFFPYAPEVKQAVAIGVWSFVAIAATQLLQGIFQTKLAMGRVVIAELVGRAVLLGGTIWVVSAGAGLHGAVLAVVAGSLINLALVWRAAGRFVPIRARFELSYWRNILRETWPIAVSIVLNLLYFRLDTIFLSLYHQPYDVGLYGAAYKILEILNTFPIMFVGLLLPTLGRSFASHDTAQFQRVFQRGFELLCLAAVPIVVGGWLLAEPLLVAIGDESFAPAAPALRLLLVAVGALFLNALSGHVVTVINRQRQMVWTYLSVATIGIVVFLVLIPRYALIGAATGAIITQSATAIVGFILVLSVMRFRLRLRALPLIGLAAGLMGLALWLLRDQSLWLLLPVGLTVYLAAIFSLRVINPSTLREIFSSPSTNLPTP